MREITKIADALFEKLRTRFEEVRLGDENAKETADPSSARFFNFDYIGKDGSNIGQVTISLIDDSSLKIYFSQDIAAGLEDTVKQEWYSFLKGIRDFAKRNLLSFDTRDILKQSLELRDIKNISKSAPLSKDDIKVTESKLSGTSRSSYQAIGPSKLIVRHTGAVDETKFGSRTRNIESIFVETARGERFLLDHKNLHGARALAIHLSEGGKITDERSEHINSLVKEMGDMSYFVRSMKHRTFEDVETSGMVDAASQRYYETKKSLKAMRNRRGYNNYFGMWIPTANNSDDSGAISEIKDRFVKRIFDERLESAMPYVYKAYVEHQKTLENKYLNEFDQWIEEQKTVEDLEMPESNDNDLDEEELTEVHDSDNQELATIRSLAGLVK